MLCPLCGIAIWAFETVKRKYFRIEAIMIFPAGLGVHSYQSFFFRFRSSAKLVHRRDSGILQEPDSLTRSRVYLSNRPYRCDCIAQKWRLLSVTFYKHGFRYPATLSHHTLNLIALNPSCLSKDLFLACYLESIQPATSDATLLNLVGTVCCCIYLEP